MNATVFTLLLATVFAPPARTSAQRSTRIYVCTTPPGASIVLDGKELGTSDGLFVVPPGVRKITLEMDGYTLESPTVDIREGWITRVEVQLSRKGTPRGIPSEQALFRKAHLPDADTEGVPIVLDLASGEMLEFPAKPEKDVAPTEQPDEGATYYTRLGKGDLAFDQELVCLRGGKIELWKNGAAGPLKATGNKDDATTYQLPKLPCELLVTTPDTRRFLVRLLAETEDRGLDLEYCEHMDTPTEANVTREPASQAPTPDLEGFGPTRTLLIHDDGSKAACMVDLDTGELSVRPSGDEAKGISGEEWMASKGIDAGCETNAAAPGLWGVDMVVLPVANDVWERASVVAIQGALRNARPGSPAIMSALGGLPRTFYFATREGAKGILQITAQTKDEQGEAYQIRYRLIADDLKLGEVKAAMNGIETAMELYRLDTGKYPPRGRALEALFKCPENMDNPEDWKGPYLKTNTAGPPKDPWGNDYQVELQELGGHEGPVILSLGPDGRPNTPDDIRSRKVPKTDLPAGVLEFRIAANEDEAETFAQTGKDLAWYESAMKEANNLVVRKEGEQDQVLLWQTPDKSLSASKPGEKKWSVLAVSIIAEPGKPARIGVTFDVEGGRRLQKLTAGNLNRQLAMLVDGRVVNCPTIRAAIGERVEITGNFTKTELARLATALQAGMETIPPTMPAEPAR